MDFSNMTAWISSFPFTPFLNSNYIPSDAELMQIKSLLVQPSKTLQKIENEMLRLQERLKLLEKKHEELNYHLSACRSLVTLPRRLPDDILCEIFHHSLPIGVHACLKRQSAPLVFTEVCSRWRQLALSTPTLWSTIHIPLANVANPPQHGMWHLAQEESTMQATHQRRATATIEWLKRSRSLSVHISLFGGPNPISSSFFDLYTKSLVPSSSRWRSLFLQAPGAFLQEIASVSARDLKALESLFLHFERSPGVRLIPFADSPWIKSELFMAPSLRKLSIRQDLFDPAAICIKWWTLTHLEIGGAPDPRSLRHSPYLSLSKASSILTLCARLVYCSIELGPSWSEQGDNIETMHLAVLQRLSIGERIDIRPFIEKLNMPALEELSFRSIIISREESNCLTVLSKTRETVRKLEIDHEFLSNQHFLECLRHCPSLVHLTVRQQGRRREHYERDEENRKHFRIDDSFLERLTKNETDSLCPYLEEFICRLDTHFTLTGFLEFLWRKQMIGQTLGLAKLKSLSIERLPNPCSADEFNLPEISEMLQPYFSDMKFQNKSDYSGRLEPHEFVAADYGNSALQYADVWKD